MDGLLKRLDTLPPGLRLHAALAVVICAGVSACGWHEAKLQAPPPDDLVISPAVIEEAVQNAQQLSGRPPADSASFDAHRSASAPTKRNTVTVVDISASTLKLSQRIDGQTEQRLLERLPGSIAANASGLSSRAMAAAMEPACCASSPSSSPSSSPFIEISSMHVSFPWILLFGLGATAGLILGHALGVWHTRAQLRREQARQRPSSIRLLSHEPSLDLSLLQAPGMQADADEVPVVSALPDVADVPSKESVEVSPASQPPLPSVQTFNARSLPGIAYIGKSFQPKLAFEPLHDAPVGLRVRFDDEATDLLGSLERLLRPSADWKLRPSEVRSSAGPLEGDEVQRSDAVYMPTETSAATDRVSQVEDQAELLQSQLARQPHNLALVEQLGRLRLARANNEPEEFERARMLDASIVQLGRLAAERIDTAVPQALLGEVGHHRVLLGPSLDLLLLEMSEKALRRARLLGISNDYRTAPMLHELLMITVPGLDRQRTVQRLEEARALAMESLSTQDADTPMWREALLRNDLLLTQYACRNITARRLRYRELYAADAEAMQHENEPGVLAAWVELLCAMAKLHTGDAAQARYVEAEETLERLRQHDEGGSTHAYALAGFVLDREHERPSNVGLDMIRHAESAVLPHLGQHPRLRLQAAQLAMAQARHVPASGVAALCRQVLSWAGPLTSSPSLMLPALRVVLEALLTSDEANATNDRRVYARCLEVIVAPDDAESLNLLADVAFREQRFADGCRHCARSWRAGGALTQPLLNAWQAGSAHWAGTTPPDADFAENRSDLRMAWAGRGAARVAAGNH